MISVDEKNKEISDLFNIINNGGNKEYLQGFFHGSKYYHEDYTSFCVDVVKSCLDTKKLTLSFKNMHLYEHLQDVISKSLQRKILQEILKKDKDLLFVFLEFLLYGKNRYNHYLAFKGNELLKELTEKELFESTDVIIFNDGMVDNYLNEKTIDSKLEKFQYLINENVYSTSLFVYINHLLRQDVSLINHIADVILKIENNDELKFELISDCNLWRKNFLPIIKERKHDFLALIKDDFKYLKKSRILFYIICILQNESNSCQMIASGMWVNNFKFIMKKYTNDEIKLMMLDFKKEYPNLFKKLYIENKCIRKSKKGEVRGLFEKLMIEISLNNNVENYEKRKRI